TTRQTLREELHLPEAPRFEIELPPGWSRREVSSDTLTEISAAAKRNMMKAHQPQMYGAVERLLHEAFDGMKRAGAFEFFAPIEASAEAPSMVASLLARIRRTQDGQSLDRLVSDLIRVKGAAPLLGDKRTIRYEDIENVRVETETFVNHSVTYLTPVPGSKRRRALELVASLVRPVAVGPESEHFIAQKYVMDLCVASLRWSRG